MRSRVPSNTTPPAVASMAALSVARWRFDQTVLPVARLMASTRPMLPSEPGRARTTQPRSDPPVAVSAAVRTLRVKSMQVSIRGT